MFVGFRSVRARFLLLDACRKYNSMNELDSIYAHCWSSLFRPTAGNSENNGCSGVRSCIMHGIEPK